MILSGQILNAVKRRVSGFNYCKKSKRILVEFKDELNLRKELEKHGYYMQYVGSHHHLFLYKYTQKENKENGKQRI